jgi:hypothetical protein
MRTTKDDLTRTVELAADPSPQHAPTGPAPTPGPWLVGERYADSIAVRTEAQKSLIAYASTHRNSVEANARLIAAAPDYHEHAYHLAMLVLQSQLYLSDPDVRDQVDNVLAIHQKANGR